MHKTRCPRIAKKKNNKVIYYRTTIITSYGKRNRHFSRSISKWNYFRVNRRPASASPFPLHPRRLGCIYIREERSRRLHCFFSESKTPFVISVLQSRQLLEINVCCRARGPGVWGAWLRYPDRGVWLQDEVIFPFKFSQTWSLEPPAAWLLKMSSHHNGSSYFWVSWELSHVHAGNCPLWFPLWPLVLLPVLKMTLIDGWAPGHLAHLWSPLL